MFSPFFKHPHHPYAESLYKYISLSPGLYLTLPMFLVPGIHILVAPWLIVPADKSFAHRLLPIQPRLLANLHNFSKTALQRRRPFQIASLGLAQGVGQLQQLRLELHWQPGQFQQARQLPAKAGFICTYPFRRGF